MNVPLDAIPYFDAITCSPTTGAVSDADSTPTFAVYENGTDTDMGVGGNMTKRTSLTGNYRCNFTCSAANGFELGKWYNVIASATVGTVAGKARIGNFRIVSAEAVTGYVASDATKIAGQTITAAAGVTFPSSVASPTNITAGTITTVTSVTNGVTVSDKTGFSLSSAGVQAIWDALTSAMTTVGSIAKFLIDRLDATISSRMATFTYTAPPAAATVATAVRTELTTELGRIDVAVSSRLPTTSYTTPPTAVAIANEVEAQIIDETDSEKVLTAITDKIASVNPDLGGLTVAAIAAGVRTNLTTELGRIDAPITSRMATFSYTTPPTAAAIRAEIDSNSTKLDVTVGSRLPTSGYTAPPSAGDIAAAVNPVTLAASQPNYAPALADDVANAFDVIADGISAVSDATTATAYRSALGLASANLDTQFAAIPVPATFDEMAQSILLRKITFDSGSGQFIIWDQAGTSELGRLTPTTSSSALPIIGMQPV